MQVIRSLRPFVLLLIIAARDASALSNWFVDKQDIGDPSLSICAGCTFIAPDGGWTIVGFEAYTNGLIAAHYAADGTQRWSYQNAGNFQFPNGPLSASQAADGSVCVVSQNLLANQQNTISAIKLDANGQVAWQSASLGQAIEPFGSSNGVIACTPDGGAAVGHDGTIVVLNSAGISRWSQPLDASSSGTVSSISSRPDSSVVAAGFANPGPFQVAPMVASFSANGSPEWNVKDPVQSISGGEQAYLASDGSIRFVRQHVNPANSAHQLRVSSVGRNGNVSWDDVLDQSLGTYGSIGVMLDSRFALDATNSGSPLSFRLFEFDGSGNIVLDQAMPPLAGANSCSMPALADGHADAVLSAYSCRTVGNAYLADVRRIDNQGRVTFQRDLYSLTGPEIHAAQWSDAGIATVVGTQSIPAAQSLIGIELTQFGPDTTLFSSLSAPIDTVALAMAVAADGYLVSYGSAEQETFSKLDVHGRPVWSSHSTDNAHDATLQAVALSDGGAARIWREQPQNSPAQVHAERVSSNGQSLWAIEVPAADPSYSSAVVAAWVRSNGNINAVLSDGNRIEISPDGTSIEQSSLPLPSQPNVLIVQNDGILPWAILASGISVQGGTATCWARAFGDDDIQSVAAATYACPASAGTASFIQFSVASFDGSAFIAAFNPTPLGLTSQIDVVKLAVPGSVVWDTQLSFGNGQQRLKSANGYVFLSFDTYAFGASFGAMLQDDGNLVWQRELTNDVGVDVVAAPHIDGSLVGSSISHAASTMNVFALDAVGAVRFVDKLPVAGIARAPTQRFGFKVLNSDEMVFGTYLIDQAGNRHAVFGVFGDVVFADGFEAN